MLQGLERQPVKYIIETGKSRVRLPLRGICQLSWKAVLCAYSNPNAGQRSNQEKEQDLASKCKGPGENSNRPRGIYVVKSAKNDRKRCMQGMEKKAHVYPETEMGIQ